MTDRECNCTVGIMYYLNIWLFEAQVQYLNIVIILINKIWCQIYIHEVYYNEVFHMCTPSVAVQGFSGLGASGNTPTSENVFGNPLSS